MKNYVLTVNVISYNQVLWIQKYLDSILEQKTDFDYIVRIFDDCSTDGTQDICREYEQKYPDKVKLFPAPQNLGEKKGVLVNALRSYENIETPYFVFIEGDDFLYSDDVFQTEKDLLDKYSECSFVYGKTYMMEKDEYVGIPYPNGLSEGIISKQFCYEHPDTYVFSNLCSRMVRTACVKVDYEHPGDSIIDSLCFFNLLLYGNAYFCNKTFGVYRKTSCGVVTGISFWERAKTLLADLEEFSRKTEYKFDINLKFFFIEDIKARFYNDIGYDRNFFLNKYYLGGAEKKEKKKKRKKIIKIILKSILPGFIPMAIHAFRDLDRKIRGKSR